MNIGWSQHLEMCPRAWHKETSPRCHFGPWRKSQGNSHEIRAEGLDSKVTMWVKLDELFLKDGKMLMESTLILMALQRAVLCLWWTITPSMSNGILVNQDVAFFTEQRLQARYKRGNVTPQSGQFLGTNPLDKFGKRLRCLTIFIFTNTNKQCMTMAYAGGTARPSPNLQWRPSEYNETVAVDLHELEPGVWYLHIINHFTYFSAGNTVKTKGSSESVDSFIYTWKSVHIPLRQLYSDNRRECNNEEMKDMAKNNNIDTRTTTGYSPWSKSLLDKRDSQTLIEIILRMKQENGYDWPASSSETSVLCQ